jgi:hypothetical protein
MPAAAIPECELRRVAALRSFHILDTATDENYNRFTRLAAGILDGAIIQKCGREISEPCRS